MFQNYLDIDIMVSYDYIIDRALFGSTELKEINNKNDYNILIYIHYSIILLAFYITLYLYNIIV